MVRLRRSWPGGCGAGNPHPPPAVPLGVTTTTLPWSDPRELIDVGVLLANGRLAPRRFTSRAEAEAWARPEEGEEVVELNTVCQCDL